MKRLNKTESPILVLLCVLCFQRQSFRFLFYFTADGVKCRVAAIKRLPVLHHSADYIFYFLWDHWAHSGYFENRILLKPLLGGICSTTNYIAAYEATQ